MVCWDCKTQRHNICKTQVGFDKSFCDCQHKEMREGVPDELAVRDGVEGLPPSVPR